MINIPIGSNAAFRASAYRDSESGYLNFVEIDPNVNKTFTGNGAGTPTGFTKNGANYAESYGVRAALAISLTDDLKVGTSVLYNNSRQDAYSLYTPNFGYVQRGYFLEPIADKFVFADAGIDWDVHWAKIVSTTSYYDSTDQTLQDQTEPFSYFFFASGEGLPKVPSPTYLDNKEWTHETRLVSSWHGPLQAVAGVFFTHRENPFGFLATGQGLPQLLGAPIPNDVLFQNVSVRNRQERAVYSELTYNTTPWLSLIAGLRWYNFRYSNSDLLLGSPLLVVNEKVASRSDATASGVDPRFRIEVRPGDNELIYASASKGFRMGGANVLLPNTPACLQSVQAFFGPTATHIPPDFSSDSLWSYELGFKGTFLQKHLTFNASVYHIDWKNTQVPILLESSQCPFTGLSTNVGAVKSNGFELEAELAPLQGLDLHFAVSHIHEYVSSPLAFPGATLSLAPEGGSLPDVPGWEGSILSQYKFPLGPGVDGFVRADYRYEGSRLAALGYTAQKTAFNIVNLRLGLDYRTWEWALFANNLNNARPSFVGVPAPATDTIGTYRIDETERPRTIGLTIFKHF
jgi:outer membrane receptor protein involved in Fe transport